MLQPHVMPERLAAFLALHEPDLTDVEVVGYEVMTGGYSRLLARAEVVGTRNGERWHQTFVLRGDPPPDRVLIVTDREVEHAVLRSVQHRVPTSQVRYFDPTGEHLDTPTLVLDYVDAHSLLPYMAGRDDNSHLVVPLADAAAAFHTIPIHELPPVLDRPASWDDYLTRRIDEWRQAALDHVESAPIMRYVAAWLGAHRPAPVELGLIHGDFQSANLMYDERGHIVVLDWELAQIGDPREDLGYFRAVAQAAGPDIIAIDEDAFCARYRELTGMTEEQLNPAVMAYFLILGVVGTVRKILEGAAAFARGDNRALTSVFNLSSVQFGASVWLPVSEQLETAFAMAKGAS